MRDLGVSVALGQLEEWGPVVTLVRRAEEREHIVVKVGDTRRATMKDKYMVKVEREHRFGGGWIGDKCLFV